MFISIYYQKICVQGVAMMFSFSKTLANHATSGCVSDLKSVLASTQRTTSRLNTIPSSCLIDFDRQ